jgi:hypothetical protein
MPTKTNRALLELMREIMEQNAHGLITDWETICSISQYAAKALTPADEEQDAAEPSPHGYVDQD